ncbi:hypothetical protein FLACOL_01531 [Flavobacterium columnare]|uniref:Class I lanthipeptide n=2 Tax=Flavobacterium TaxID=237 RepID=A0ABW8PKQ1_9FLAO|nr:class I lanthipeptide [Flavobacterium columnare]SPE77536.1 hypothetical protein FLACOL_01531 [Flavobacterium columnare]
MKNIELNKGVNVNREALTKLQDTQKKDVKGGGIPSSCYAKFFEIAKL